MKLRNAVIAGAVAPLLLVGVVSAQSSSLNVTSMPVTSAVSAGNSVALGSYVLTSPGGAFTLNSVPLNFTAGNGGLASNVTNCQIFNNGTQISATNSAAVVTGSNSIALSSPLTVNFGAPVTLNLRCDVASSTVSGSTFQFQANTSSAIGTTVSGPALTAQVDFVPRVPAGLTNAIMGVITLEATKSNTPIVVTSIPLAVSASGGANLNAISGCVLTNMTGTVLTTGSNGLPTIGTNGSFKLDSPMTIPAGQGMLLVIRCNTASNATVGGTLTMSVSPQTVQATANGAPVTVQQGLLANGSQGTNSAAIVITAIGSTPGGTTTTPGVPNTGAGGDAGLNFVLLTLSGLAAVFATRFIVLASREQ